MGTQYGRRMYRCIYGLVPGAVLTGFALLLLDGHYRERGPVVLSLTARHGLHLGDLFVIAGWAVAVLSLIVLARLGGPPSKS